MQKTEPKKVPDTFLGFVLVDGVFFEDQALELGPKGGRYWVSHVEIDTLFIHGVPRGRPQILAAVVTELGLQGIFTTTKRTGVRALAARHSHKLPLAFAQNLQVVNGKTMIECQRTIGKQGAFDRIGWGDFYFSYLHLQVAVSKVWMIVHECRFILEIPPKADYHKMQQNQNGQMTYLVMARSGSREPTGIRCPTPPLLPCSIAACIIEKTTKERFEQNQHQAGISPNWLQPRQTFHETSRSMGFFIQAIVIMAHGAFAWLLAKLIGPMAGLCLYALLEVVLVFCACRLLSAAPLNRVTWRNRIAGWFLPWTFFVGGGSLSALGLKNGIAAVLWGPLAYGLVKLIALRVPAETFGQAESSRGTTSLLWLVDLLTILGWLILGSCWLVLMRTTWKNHSEPFTMMLMHRRQLWPLFLPPVAIVASLVLQLQGSHWWACAVIWVPLVVVLLPVLLMMAVFLVYWLRGKPIRWN